MDITILTFKLLVLFLPGFIYLYIVRKLTKDKTFNTFEVFSFAIIFGLISYLVLQILHSSFGYNTLSIWNVFVFDENETNSINQNELLQGCLVGIFLAITYVYLHNKKSIYKLLLSMNITEKYGDESTFYTFLHSDVVTSVHIYDFDNAIIHYGDILAYSEDEKGKEILLYKNIIYNMKSGEVITEVDQSYLSFSNSSNFIINKA